ncbi:hypothetical protein [Tropicimonas aquimaris]|uniref:Uncharacterized protein n=1 Tax=Tropicimonas aquimaris TaxID=914152 RepID=A0ABW3IJ29_9RHOB
MKEFSGRLRRIDKIHRRGGGFEAAGTLGQSHYTREKERRERRTALRPALMVLVVMVVFKGFLLAALGTETYAAKVVALKDGSIVEQIGGFVMAVDPLSRAIATWVSPLFG